MVKHKMCTIGAVRRTELITVSFRDTLAADREVSVKMKEAIGQVKASIVFAGFAVTRLRKKE